MIIQGAEAFTKAMKADLPYEIKVHVASQSPDGQKRIVSEYVAPGENKPFAVMTIEAEGDLSRFNPILSMFLPTVSERLAAGMVYAQSIRELTEIVIDGRAFTLQQLYGASI